MDHPIEPSILEAIEQGRGERGGNNPQAWSRHRAQLLTLAHQGQRRIRIAGEFGLSEGHVNVLIGEACGAVLRGGSVSTAADRVCAARWRSWCETGNTDACDRLGRTMRRQGMPMPEERRSPKGDTAHEAQCRDIGGRWDEALQRCLTPRVQRMTLRELISMVQTLSPKKHHG